MSNTTTFPLIVPENFIQASRDSGYKNLGSALAELVDNAFEAKATRVSLAVEKGNFDDTVDVRVIVADDGHGMNSRTLRHALQFGWSSRFNKRDSHGRYGMGLPNASLSQARRVEVLSSPDGRNAATVRLDLDEIVNTANGDIAPTQIVPMTEFRRLSPFDRGTVVIWSCCDRLVDRKLGPLMRRLRADLSRLFRYQLWAGKSLTLNKEAVQPFDPLFEREGVNLVGSLPFGPEQSYEVEVPGTSPSRTSVINVRFTELPVKKWYSLSNADKNARGIAKNAGVSIVRAGREIDHGWFFMGGKRKENYDDWWRCEVRFEPDLDELFGVTHTKQEIHPTETLLSVLVPDIERIARELNSRARRAFVNTKVVAQRRDSEQLAERYDSLIEPPSGRGGEKTDRSNKAKRGGRGRVAGIEYRLRSGRLESPCFYRVELRGSRLTVTLNDAHPFVRRAFVEKPSGETSARESQRNIELMILAAARTELKVAKGRVAKTLAEDFRRSWSNILATFLA